MTGHLLMDYKKSISFCPDLFYFSLFYIWEGKREKEHKLGCIEKWGGSERNRERK